MFMSDSDKTPQKENVLSQFNNIQELAESYFMAKYNVDTLTDDLQCKMVFAIKELRYIENVMTKKP